MELYRITNDLVYLEDARRTFATASRELVDTQYGVLPDEGDGDGGLFKGILIRYTGELVKVDPAAAEVATFLGTNAGSLWERGKFADEALFGTDWTSAPTGVISLSSQLSGIKLLEKMAELSKR